jgi:hypothetical protein
MIIKTTLAPAFLPASLCGTVQARKPEKGNVAFQSFVSDDKLTTTLNMKIETMSGKTVTGSPFSATEESHTLQVPGDGTRIGQNESDKYFRDSDGRTRTERNNGDTVIVSNPVSGVTSEISTANKTARKIMVSHPGPVQYRQPGRCCAAGQFQRRSHSRKNIAQSIIVTAEAPVAGTLSSTEARSFALSALPAADLNIPLEDLGTQIVNGAPAKCARSTVTIPAGQIGNDRQIEIVSERRSSGDVRKLIKSSGKDPGFGETTYEVTNILRGLQGPTLFQIPCDFKVNVR